MFGCLLYEGHFFFNYFFRFVAIILKPCVNLFTCNLIFFFFVDHTFSFICLMNDFNHPISIWSLLRLSCSLQTLFTYFHFRSCMQMYFIFQKISSSVMHNIAKVKWKKSLFNLMIIQIINTSWWFLKIYWEGGKRWSSILFKIMLKSNAICLKQKCEENHIYVYETYGIYKKKFIWVN